MANKESKEIAKRESGGTVTPFREMERWLDETFRRPFFGGRSVRPFEEQEIMPAVNIFEDDGQVVVKAELPGIKKEDLDITLTDDTISIAGEKKQEDEVKKKDYYRYESSYGSFCRTFTLPSEVQTDKVESKMQDGVLEIRIPKTEEAKMKEVKVKVA